MSKLSVVKGVLNVTTAIGVGSIVGNAIYITAKPDAGVVKKVTTGVGGFVLSAMVSSAAMNFNNRFIDTLVEGVKDTAVQVLPED